MTIDFFTEHNKPLVNTLLQLEQEFIDLRHFFHKHPELSCQEFKTTQKITELLHSWGIKTDTSLLPTGVIGILKKGNSNKRIGLRADIDALPIEESTNLPYSSLNKGIMHACGHDGHLTALLYAAKVLSQAEFEGEIIFIFQPNEEGTAGAKQMIDAGLFDKYPVDCVFAFHNHPGAPVGHVLINRGPQMAGTVGIDITIKGIGCHAAHPYRGVDTILVASHVIVALQSITSRNISPLDSAVITIGSIHGGSANNIIPETVQLKGTLRYFDVSLRETMKRRIHEITQNTCSAFGATAEISLTDGYIPTINHDQWSDFVLNSASNLIKKNYIDTSKSPSMGAEDFGFMLDVTPGAYFYIGNGEDSSTNKLHNHGYDFNDQMLIVAAALWHTLTLDYFNKI